MSECLLREVVTTELVIEHFQDEQDNTFALIMPCMSSNNQAAQRCNNRRNHSTSYRKVAKKIKIHHAVIDFANRFIIATVKMEEELSSEVLENENIVHSSNYKSIITNSSSMSNAVCNECCLWSALQYSAA